ncbi:heparan-alpha-glucosaminide n-acetyltransferase, partial [Biomphalaria glabrata]
MTSGDDVSSLSYCVSQDDVTNSTETVVETTSLRDVSPSTSTSTSTSTTTTTTTTTSTTPVDDTPTQTTPDATTLGEILDTPEDSNDPISDYIKKYNEAVVYVGEEDDRPEDTPTKPELGIDQAWFTVNSTVDFVVEIWAQSDQCYKCDLMLITKIEANSVSSFAVNTTSGTDLRLVRVHPAGHPEQLCGFKSTFLESGDYWVFLGFPPPDEEMTCKVILANDPDISEL